MLTRLRSFLATLLIKTPVRIALGLVVAYLAFAWLGFEPLVKWAAPKFIADKSHHQLVIGSARFDPLALSVDIKGLKLNEPDGQPLLAFDELFVDFDATSLFRWAWSFDAVRLSGPHARVLLLPGGRLNWSGLLDAFKSPDEKEPAKPLPRLLIRRISLERGTVDLADRTVGFETRFNPINFSLTELSTLPNDKGAYTLAATTELGARIHWKGDVGLKPVVASGDLSVEQVRLDRLWPYEKGRLNMAPPEGIGAVSLSYRAGWADKRLSFKVDKLALAVDKLALRGTGDKMPAIVLDRLALSGGRFDLDKKSLDIDEIALAGGKIDLARDRNGRLAILDWFAPPASAAKPEPPVQAAAKPAVSSAATSGEPWRIKLARFALDGLGVRLTDAGFAAPLTAEIGNVKLGFSANAEAGAGEPKAAVEGMELALSGLRLSSAALKSPLFTLDGISVRNGKADLAARSAGVDKVLLSNGRLAAERDAQGRIALLEAFKPAVSTASAARAVGEKPATGGAEPWHWQVGEVGLEGFQLSAVDRSVRPAGGLTLLGVNASIRDLTDNLKAALPVKLAFHVQSGGRFEATGKVVPAKPSADLHLKLADLALAPAQPYLSQAANLTLASGRASVDGRLKFDGKPLFDGGFAVDDLLLNETDGGARFLAWKHLLSSSVHAGTDALNLEELKLDGLGAKLVIYPDKTVNLKKILKSPPPPSGGEGTTATPSAAPSPGPAGEGNTPSFRIGIDRITVDNGELYFADLSLALPFGTRIHHFKGHFNGIANQPGNVAQLELDGQVDDYGLARAVGQIDLFNPTGFMDIKTVFRNVEMTNLTPYSATFAGRKIASGKLSLDLEYKIKNRQLLGENQVVMDKLTLGERVESPTAKNLPLDLAIAILQDSDGKIDLGLPVSGSLDDPQFSYGQIIWKAITNVLTKIVTAPFRALASLFGGNADKLEKIAFEAGETALTPPEREKFKSINQILGKRPGLALTVHGAWNAEIDRPVMQERQLRRAVAEKMGIKLAEGEDAGPVSTANAKVQAALEALYAARFGETEWNSLAGKWRQANPEKKAEGGAGQLMSRLKGMFAKKEEALSAEDQAQLKGADLHALLYRRLLAKESVGDEALKALAEKRAQAIVDGLVALGAPRERIRAEAIAKLEGEGREVPAKLELGVAKK